MFHCNHRMKYVVVAAFTLGVPFTAMSQDLKVGGFVDAQYQWFNTPPANNQGQSSFLLNDAALMLSKKVGNGGAVLDVAIQNGTAPDSLNVGVGFTQAYAHYAYENGLNWRLGQFDSIYGFEANDSVDIAFSRQGILFALAQPKTHTGLLAGYDFSSVMGLKFLVSNPQGTTTLGTANPEFGAQFNLNPGAMSLKLGALLNKVGTETHYLIDAVVGMELGDVLLNVQADVMDTGAADTGLGFMAHAINSFGDTVKGGVRLEYLSKVGPHSILSATVGPQFKMTDALTTKVDYSLASTKDVSGADSETSHTAAIAAVYRF